MMLAVATFLFWGSVAAVVYHHAVFPVLLRTLARRRPAPPEPPAVPEAALPPITLIIPAYQEAGYVAEKLADCARLDYPRALLRVIVACDGCTDGTEIIARDALAHGPAAGLHAEVRAFAVNRGKVAVLNDVISSIPDGIVALSDVSASLTPDALRRVAAHFAAPEVGVVAGTYALREAGSAGEAQYWRYQTAIKADEARIAAPIGVHGAFYAFRRRWWEPLPPDTINDDVILPMSIVAKGERAIYDRAIVATEEERTHRAQEFRRRVRIGSGNLQQALWLWRLADPRRPGLAFVFLSGKWLRAMVPFLLVVALAANAVLAFAGPPL